MKTIAIIKRTFDPEDYEDIKFQAKGRKIKMKDLAKACGYEYGRFHAILTGHGDGTKVAERLLEKDFEINERN